MERVVITGTGVVSPIGNDSQTFWKSLHDGVGGAGPITRFNASEFVTRYAAEVKDFDPRERIDRRDARKMDLFSQFAVYAAREAFEEAGLLESTAVVDPERFGVVLGVGIGGFQTIEDSIDSLREKGPSRVSPMTIPKMISNIAPAHVAINLQAYGPVHAITTACASGGDAIGNAMRLIREGLADVMIAGGTEAPITPLAISGFNVIQALSSKYNEHPERASRPFDKDRDGFLIAEGAGVLVLESLSHAQARGATIIAELAGGGSTNDANHLTAPHPEGRGAISAMKMALTDADLAPEDIDYVNAHGTSTPINDPTETKAIRAVFGDHADKLAVSSTKSMTGHMFGAAGGIEAVVAALAIHNQFAPPTINFEEPGEDCDLDYVPNTGRSMPIRAVLSNSLGFGGHNSTVIVKRFT